MSSISPFAIDSLPGAGKARELFEICQAQANRPFILDAGEIAAVTAANLQVLLHLKQVKAEEGQTFEIINMPDSFCESLTLLGVDPQTFVNEATE